jgi:hypothetical protein
MLLISPFVKQKKGGGDKTMSVEESYDIKAVAKTLSITERQARLLCQRARRNDPGGLPSWRLGKKWLVKESDLQAFVDARSKTGRKTNKQEA